MSVLGRCFLRKGTIKRLLFLTTRKFVMRKMIFFLFGGGISGKKFTNNTQGKWSKLETPHEKCKKISQEFIQ